MKAIRGDAYEIRHTSARNSLRQKKTKTFIVHTSNGSHRIRWYCSYTKNTICKSNMNESQKNARRTTKKKHALIPYFESSLLDSQTAMQLFIQKFVKLLAFHCSYAGICISMALTYLMVSVYFWSIFVLFVSNFHHWVSM